jgi:CRP/FNR family transcriptional regulator, cyclic AMP receptor protein
VSYGARERLLEVDPDLAESLGPEEFAEARQLTVPVVTIGQEDGALERLNRPGAFAALVAEGMVLHRVRVADQLGMHLLGPGDIVPLTALLDYELVSESSRRAVPGTRLAILGREVLFAARKWPSLLASLELRVAQQGERLSVQLVICQLPRVDQRLLSLLWLLAESWGRVTPAGTALPLKLTHEALGALIGARRPTITLALRDLSERGAIVRQPEGWLLLERPRGSAERGEPSRVPSLVNEDPETWARVDGAAAATRHDAAAALRERLAWLREEHARNRDQFNQSLAALTRVRERCQAIRDRIERESVIRRRRRSPSS